MRFIVDDLDIARGRMKDRLSLAPDVLELAVEFEALGRRALRAVKNVHLLEGDARILLPA